jgi:putative aminophosphonate oxidoreductase
MAAPSSPVSLAATSWWLREVGLVDPEPPLEGERRADVCVVGGGFTGLWTALRLIQLEPDLDVVLIEADICGAGASGRNGGFVMSLWHQFLALERVCGGPGALWLARASTEAVADIGAFCEEHQIDAQYRPDGWLWTATNSAQVGAWESTINAIERHGEQPFARVGSDELQARIGSSHLAGVYERTCASIQPAALARGLLRAVLGRGVTVFERSPVNGIGRSTPLVVRTARGQITADRVVIAMNAWSGQLRELRNAFAVVSSDIVITDPIPDELERVGPRDGVCISDSRLMVHYYRATRDGRLAFGKGGGQIAHDARIGRSFSGGSPLEGVVAARLRATYPSLADVPIAESWTGPIDRTVDGLPFFFALGRADLVCGAGFSGNGVGPCALGGRILASLTLRRDDEWSRCGLVRPPPRGMPAEPVRYLGGRLVRAAVARKERAEDAGRSPAWIDRSLAGLAPAGLVPLR